ncbi:NAD-dependent epimerase [Psychromonas sp. psych-6C06]|uniref:NAD(P)-dependent oxidoreductase n=1 Tax=Psychromonas sp. psych-6C06 TaxID=2058089 RepID=UPI000C32BF1A|nr:NAD(P)-binding oxidoreductase [Psychromonas sp. psych-6C06]PKF61588.1 NAD-dependent epimerase [Psychromonas sp. psych-6C06]
MTTLVVGASGATGRLLVEQLLAVNEPVKIIVRSLSALHEILPSNVLQDERLSITEADILDLTEEQLIKQVKNCQVVISCLGHNLTLRGMFASPRRLVTQSVQRLVFAIRLCSRQKVPVKFILMNTTGNRNRLAGEKVSCLEALAMCLIRVLLPPHADNELAADYLQNNLHRLHNIEWVVVRPDSLVNSDVVSEYDIYPSPTRSAIFNAGKTSRINVAHFMCQLVINKVLWRHWKGQMPVLYNTFN